MTTQKNIAAKKRAFLWKKLVLVNKISAKVLRSRIGFKKKWSDVFAQYLTTSFGSMGFFVMIAMVIFGWVLINLKLVPGIVSFDPYPFNLLLIFVQFFAIFLSIIVLVNQNRQWKMSEVRQQIDFEINVRAEHEITKILHMLDELHTELGIAKMDRELEQMKENINIAEIRQEVELGIEGDKKMKR